MKPVKAITTHHFVEDILSLTQILVTPMYFEILHLDARIKDKRDEIHVRVVHIVVPFAKVAKTEIEAIYDGSIFPQLCHCLPFFLHKLNGWECMEKRGAH